MTDEMTIDTLMERMPKAFIPEKAADTEAVIQYHLTGDQGSDWIVRIADGACTVEEGTAEDPKLTLTADAEDYIKVITGELNAMNAFAEGKLKLKGDLSLAMKLQNWFKMPD